MDWNAKIDEVIENQLNLNPKQQTMMYVPYLVAFDSIPYPHRYKVRDFTKFSSQNDSSTIEHINWFIIQCGKAVSLDTLRVRLFSISLSGSAFAWFTSLVANSIMYWADLEKQFHQFFYSGMDEKKLSDLVSLKQRNDESVAAYMQRFRETKNWCYNLFCHTSS